MEIKFGAEVFDKSGRLLGNVNKIVRDSWSGQVSKFGVGTESPFTPLFYSPQNVAEATDTKIVLNVVFGQVNNSIQLGARVVDVNGKAIGKVDYLTRNTLTGEVTKFRLGMESSGDDVFFSPEDVETANPSEVKLKIAFDGPKGGA